MTGTDTDIGDCRTAARTPAGAPAPPPADSETILRSAARLARLGYWVWDHALDRGVFVSPELAEIHGLTPEQYLAELGDPGRMLDWFHPDDRETYRKTWFEKAKVGAPYEIEVRALRADGGVRHCREIGEPVFAENGALLRTIGTFQDVTEQREQEAARRRAEHALGERVKELSCLYDVSEIRWNDRASLPEILQAVAERLPAGFQYPDICCARVSFEGAGYTSSDFTQSSWRLASAIEIEGEAAGLVEVFYTAAAPTAAEGPFLAEERRLLDKIAEGLAASIRQRRTNVETQRTAAMLRDAAAVADLGFCVWDRDARKVTFATEHLAGIMGLTLEAYMAKVASVDGVLQLVHPDDRPVYRRFLDAPIEPGTAQKIEYRIVRDDGAVRHCREIEEAITDSDGEMRQSISTVQDITDFKQREARLEEMTQFLETQREASPLAIVTMDRAGRVISWNPAAERTFGWTATEAVGQVALWVPASESAEFKRRLDAVLRQRRVQVFEAVRLRKDGSRIEVRIHAAPLPGPGGEATGLLAMFEDVTEEAENRRALEASERRFRAVTDVMPIGVVVADQKTGVVRFANATAEWMLGLSERDIGVARSVDYYADPADRERIHAVIESDGVIKDFECQLRSADGTRFWASVAGAPIEFDGRPAYCGAFLDVSKRRALQEELHQHERLTRQTQKMEALGTLAGGIAHDFNNILQPIVMFAEDAQARLPADSPVHDDLGQVLAAAARAGDLVRKILDFGREESSSGEPHDIAALLADSVQLVRHTLPRSVRIRTEIDPDTGSCLLDPSDVTQIVTNLGVNAADAMDGKGVFRIELAREQVNETREAHGLRIAPGTYARLSFEDNGPGMPTWVIDRMFEPFFSTKPVGRGTGLGLPIVHGLVRQQHGAVFVATAPGEGTRFDIYVPLLEPKET